MAEGKMKICRKGHQREDPVISCAKCRRMRYEAHRQRENESNRQWIEKNKKQYRKTQKAYRETNPEKIKQMYVDWANKHPIHSIWRSMKARCYSTKHKQYQDYGGQGIIVCDRWLGTDGYKNFEADMGPRPTPVHTIDRISNGGNYEPSNCRWATRKEQQRNRRANVLVTIEGRTQCLGAWAEESGIGFKTLQKRLQNGWAESKLLLPPDQRYHTIGRTGQKKVA